MVKQGDTVMVHYTGKLESGEIFDTSEGREPISFTVGEGQVIRGFEEGVQGMEKGETKTITITSDEAYGPVNNELLFQVDLTQLPEGVEAGHMLHGNSPSGDVVPFIVLEVNESTAILDGNHPLAGKNLTFDVVLEDIV
jgi:peptidylprolyl isomerase